MNEIKIKNKKKKSQVEIIGIAVVIILLIIGLLFFIAFFRMTDFQVDQSDLDDQQMVNYVLNAMLSSNSDNECNKETIETLFKDCLDNHDIKGSIVCNNGKSSCDYLDEIIQPTFIEPVLGSLKKDYVLTIEGIDHISDKSNSKPAMGCNLVKKREIRSIRRSVFGNFGDVAVLQLKICYPLIRVQR